MALENRTADAQYTLGVGETHVDIGTSKNSIVVDDSERVAIGESVNAPTEEERHTLRRVAGKLPVVAYVICAVEFAERASYYGVQPLIGNFVNRPMPVGGNGYGAPPRGTQQTAGALGMGTVKSTAVSQSFSMLAYTLPMIFGWLSDTKTGRFKMICWGVAVCGVAHVLMVGSGSRELLANGNSKILYFISLYILAVGAAMFKPCISPTLLDQMKDTTLQVKTLKSGERVIVDPEATTERVMLWFYLLINIGGFMGVPTSYSEKYVGWWLAFLLPLILYLPLGPLLWWLRKRLVLNPPGGSDLTNVIKILGICFKRGGFKNIIKGGFFEPAKPTNLALSSKPIDVPWNDAFVDDVKRAFQATGIFCFFPIQSINDNGLGGAESALTTMLTTNGVPNDVINNINSLSIIVGAPLLNYGLYPLLRNRNIHFGPIARITFGLFLSSIGGLGYTLLNYYAYKIGPCGHYGSSASCVDADGVSLVSSITIWYTAIPLGIGGISELFVNVPAYGLAYSMAPKNMRGLVSALNLLSSAFAYAFGLAFAGLIKDPYLTWDFGGPTIVGFVATVAFWWIYKDLDKAEYQLTQNGDYHKRIKQEREDEMAHEIGESGDSISEKKVGELEAPVDEEKKGVEIADHANKI
ncbi:probable peptide transporter PTR2 [Phialocephala subalpina]|uniref:Probable peptide transporter PTR2 n=1 Tax=Phialocephala subalpina TaxID=576137 RepID=A0A1L7WBV1_9HELO|nr:probable peptide transporter PTR2 [Phialocephala subalpina]